MTKSQSKFTYLPKGLSGALEPMLAAPLTLVKAGTGFGKTTAVSEYLRRHLRPDVSCHWYTCFGEPPERVWEGICALFSRVDRKTADYLSKLDLPTEDNLGHISLLMGDLDCENETVLVIDNYQNACFSTPYRLLDALSLHRCERLHLIVITQPLQIGKMLSISSHRICCVDQEAFCFNKSEIKKLFAYRNVKISEEQADGLYAVTEGWAAALSLHLSGYLSNGRLEEKAGMNELMERSFWYPLNAEQREFFLTLSVLDTVTEVQAAVLMELSAMPEELWRTVRNNAFIRQVGSEFIPHSLLKDYMAEKLAVQSEEFKKQVWRRAGQACRARGKNMEAVLFYFQTGDYTAVLNTPLNGVQMAELVLNESQSLELMILKAEDSILGEHLETLLAFAVKAVLRGKIELTGACCLRLQRLAQLPELSGDRRSYARAGLELITAFRVYNKASELSVHYRAAWESVGGPYDLYRTSDPWTSCAPSVVFMLWREAGDLAEACRILTEDVHYYCELTCGHGTGSPEAMQADMLLLAGEEQAAEQIAYKALYRAEKYEQDSLCFCAELTLCRLALLRGDVRGFETAIGRIRRRAFEGRESRCVITSEVCAGFIYALLGQEERIPQWLGQLSSIRRHLYPIAAPFALIVYAHLLRCHDPVRFKGEIGELISEAEELNLLLPRIYYWLEQAVLYEQSGYRALARERLELALSQSLPDRVYLPAAEYYPDLSGVLEDPQLVCDDKEGLCRILAMGRKLAVSAAAIRAALLPGASPLTPREREIALLAKKRLSTQEIAGRLVISPATVKNTLSKVYDKLNVSGKSELADLNF